MLLDLSQHFRVMKGSWPSFLSTLFIILVTLEVFPHLYSRKSYGNFANVRITGQSLPILAVRVVAMLLIASVRFNK